MVLIANHTDRYIVKILETISIYLIPNIDVKIGEHYFTGRYLEVVFPQTGCVDHLHIYK